MTIKTVDAVSKLGVNGKKALKKLETAASQVESASNRRSERLAEFLVASHLEGLMFTQQVTANHAKCDRTMVSRLYRALTNYLEVFEADAKNEGKDAAEGLQTAISVFSSMGYTKFTDQYNPRLRDTQKSKAKGAHTIEDKQEGKTAEDVKMAAKSKPPVTAGGVDHMIATIRAFNEAYRAGRINMDMSQAVELGIAVEELRDLTSGEIDEADAA